MIKSKLLLVSNMYPSKRAPNFGTFVKNIYDQLLGAGLHVDKVVIDNNTRGIKKIAQYLKFFTSTVAKIPRYNKFYVHFVAHSMIPFVALSYLGVRPIIIAHVHGGDVKLLKGFSGRFFNLKRKLVERSLKISKYIIVPSLSYARYLEQEYSVSQSKITVYPSGGVDLKVFNSSNNKKRDKVIGYAGRLIESKNVDVLIESLSHLQGYSLEIVGDGEQKATLKELAKKIGVAQRVEFVPPMNQSKLVEWFKSIEVLVYPSDSESLGLVPIEAMACGTSVVLSKIPAFEELDELGLDVNIVSTLSPRKYAEKIAYSVEMNKKNATESSKKNIRIIEEKYSSSVTLEKLINVLQ